MTPSRKFVVCIGKDGVLLKTRCLLLEQAGFTVFMTTNVDKVIEQLIGGEVSTLVLCHTLSRSEAGSITSFHHEMGSRASILYLTAGGWCAAADGQKVHDVHRGPAGFLAAVKNLNAVHCWLNGSEAAARPKG